MARRSRDIITPSNPHPRERCECYYAMTKSFQHVTIGITTFPRCYYVASYYITANNNASGIVLPARCL